MPFDEKKFNSLATKGELGHALVSVTVALGSVRALFTKLKDNQPITAADVKLLDQNLTKLDELFIEITGWHQR